MTKYIKIQSEEKIRQACYNYMKGNEQYLIGIWF